MNTDENKKDPKKEWLDHNINLQADMLAKSSRIPYVTTNMNTDEIVEEFKQTNIYKTARVSGYGKKMEDWLRTTIQTLLTSEAQKRDEAVRGERERIATELDRYAHESHSATINIKHLMNLLVPNPASRENLLDVN